MSWQFFPINDFKRYSERWDTLNQRNPNTPLLSRAFVQPLLDCFASGKERLAINGPLEAPQAMAIIHRPKLGVWETWQPSQAPIGLWLQNKDSSTADLMQSLRKALPFPTLLFGITQQDPDLLPRPSHQSKISTLDYIQTARVTLSGSFEEYWTQRGKNLRQNLRRQRNRLAREEIQTRLKIITDPDQVKQAIIDYGELESAGWKKAGGTAIHIDNAQGRFYHTLLTHFCQRQHGLIFQYFYNDQLVATDLCIRDESTLIILKTTYDESITTSSPAMLMRQDAFEQIFNQQQVEKIEFYGKVMDWHTKWSEEIRTMYHINSKIL